MNMQAIIATALETTEANGLILGYCGETGRAYVLPCWEAQTATEVETMALNTAMTWADRNGCGSIEIMWGFRKDE